MSQTNTDNIRQIATWLQSQSVSSNGDPNSPSYKKGFGSTKRQHC